MRQDGAEQRGFSLHSLHLVNCEDCLAETERFELSVPFNGYDALAKRWFQPLTHVSTRVWQGAAYNEGVAPLQSP